MKYVILVALMIASKMALAEIVNVEGPYIRPGSGSSYYNVQLTVPKSVVGHCVENNGAGNIKIGSHKRSKNLAGQYSDIYGDALIGDEIFFKVYSCSFPFLTVKEIRNSKFRDKLYTFDGISHDYYLDIPENTDRYSSRFLTQTKGLLYFQPALIPGIYTSDAEILRSEHGANAYYYTIKTNCDLRADKSLKPATSLAELESKCSNGEIIRKTQQHTTGPDTVLFLGIDSQHFNGLFKQ